MRTPIPRNDEESNVLTYRAMEEPLRKAFRRYSDLTARGMLTKIANILNAAGYKGDNPQVLNRQADPSTINALEEMAQRLPVKERRKVLAKLFGQIGNGKLTVRNAIRDVTEFGRYEFSAKLYEDSRKVVRDIAAEGMLRGEYMVQKSVGMAWTFRSPDVKTVDAFLKGKWNQNDVTEFLRPMTGIVRDQVAESILLGEGTDKMAKRITNVAEIDEVRAKRIARTTTTAVANEAHMESYKRHGITQYKFRAMFNERTCPVCGDLDGRIFDVSEKSAGTNYPPIHPNCRCTTTAVIERKQREAIAEENSDAKPLTIKVSFTEWKD